MTGLTYHKRFRMELDLRGSLPCVPEPPDGYYLLPWDDGLLFHHAEVKYHSFRDQIDCDVFPNLASQDGCLKLMQAIRRRPGFLPGATWLVAHEIDYCGTIQGVRDANGFGAIQNVGVTPEHRGRGLGRLLLLHALRGFKSAGVHRAVLEVTAGNAGATALYRQIGFRARRTVYKPVLTSPAPVAEFASIR